MKKLLAEFREFLDNGSIIDAAVGLILALAFTPVITSLVDDIVMQIIAAIFGEPNFGRLSFGLGNAEIFYGNFINTVISFVAIAFILFMLLKAYNKSQKPTEEEESGPSETDLLIEIRDALQK